MTPQDSPEARIDPRDRERAREIVASQQCIDRGGFYGECKHPNFCRRCEALAVAIAEALSQVRSAVRQESQQEIERLLDKMGFIEAELVHNQMRAEAAEAHRDALLEFLNTCLCDECGGSGIADSHVTGKVECGSCEGTGHDSRKALAAIQSREARLGELEEQIDKTKG